MFTVAKADIMDEYPVQQISVTKPISEAISRVKEILFKPFDLGKWFAIGFCAFLATLGQGGSGSSGGSGGNWGRGNRGQGMGGFDGVREAITSHLPIILIIVGVGLVIGIAIMLLCIWLSSRGQFMFVHCIAENKAEVKRPWSKYLNVGNSLFLFKFAVWGASLLCIGVFTGIGALLFFVVGKGSGGVEAMGALMIVLPLLLIVIPLVIGLMVFLKFTNDFVVPIMYLRGCRCVDGWREFWGLLRVNKGNFALYLLFQMVISMAIGVIIFGLGVVTCCIACCVMGIPYLGTVLLLPLLVFERGYKLYYLAQFGDAYNVFATTAEIEP